MRRVEEELFVGRFAVAVFLVVFRFLAAGFFAFDAAADDASAEAVPEAVLPVARSDDDFFDDGRAARFLEADAGDFFAVGDRLDVADPEAFSCDVDAFCAVCDDVDFFCAASSDEDAAELAAARDRAECLRGAAFFFTAVFDDLVDFCFGVSVTGLSVLAEGK